MRTSLVIDEEILKRASELTGIEDKTLLVRMGLEVLISRESSKQLALFGGTENCVGYIKRREIRTKYKVSMNIEK